MSKFFLLLLGVLLLGVDCRASTPIAWGTYGDQSEKGYLHGWGDEWMDYSADSLAIQVKTWAVRYNTLAWVVVASDTMQAPINRERLDSMVMAHGLAVPSRGAVRSKPPVDKAPVDPEIMPKGLAAVFGGAILLGFTGQYLYSCSEPFCKEAVGKQVITGTAAVGGIALLGVGVMWVIDAYHNAK
jgi:hypothetical protein